MSTSTSAAAKDQPPALFVVIMAAMIMLIGGLIGVTLGASNADAQWQRVCVAHGAAEFVYDKAGNVSFHWKDESK